jgi:hypothetical protein
MIENSVLRVRFGLKGKALAGVCRKLHNEESDMGAPCSEKRN